MLFFGRAQPTGIKRRGDDATLLLVTNAHHDVVEFTLPEVPDGKSWFRLIDSNVAAKAETSAFEFGHCYQVTSRSLLVFVLGFEDRQPRKTREGIGALLDLAERPVVPEMM
jgi:glycogen operon protein